jgi:hypothetical protein
MRAQLWTVCVLAALVSGISGAAGAQPVESFDALAVSGTLRAGDRIDVKDATGGTTRGVFMGFTEGELLMRVGNERLEARFLERDVQAVKRAGGHAAGWGAAIGAASAFGLTAAAAKSYGDNEGGRFCGACLLQWSVISVPAGAGIGFGVGFAIDRLRRSTVFVAPVRHRSVAALPLVSRRGAGMLISVRF